MGGIGMNFYENKKSLFYHLTVLLILYLNIILTFAFIYIGLEFCKLGSIIEHYQPAGYKSTWIDQLSRSIYFSATTLLSVGYGDITPFGLARLAAMIEALIGYIMPATLVIRYFVFPERWLGKDEGI
jgi:potassium channel LctB